MEPRGRSAWEEAERRRTGAAGDIDEEERGERGAIENEEEVELLLDVMKPLRQHYERPEVSELVVCDAGVAFHRLREKDRFGRVWRRADDPKLTRSYLMLAMRTIANMYRHPFHPETEPALHAELPGGERVCGLAGKSACYGRATPKGGVSLCIRQGTAQSVNAKREISDWKVDEHGEWRMQQALERAAVREAMIAQKGDHEKLFEAAQRGRPILFSGPTGSGKTTLLNRLLVEVEEDVRVITVEDVRELQVPVPNRLHIMIPRESDNAREQGLLNPERVRNVVLRSTPDAVLIGEISPANAGLAIQMLKTGHHHCWTSIHAGSPAQATEEFAYLAASADAERGKEEIKALIEKNFVIVQTQHHHGERRISAIEYPEERAEGAGDEDDEEDLLH